MTKRLSYFYRLEVKAAGSFLKLQGRCTERCREGKSCLHLLKWMRGTAPRAGTETKGGCKEGAAIRIQTNVRAVFLKASCLAMLECIRNPPENRVCSLYFSVSASVPCTVVLELSQERYLFFFFINKVTLPRGFSPHPFRVLPSVYLSLRIPLAAALSAWLLRNEGKAEGRAAACPHTAPHGGQPELSPGAALLPPSPGRSEGCLSPPSPPPFRGAP